MPGKESRVDFGLYRKKYLAALVDGDADAAGRIVNEMIARRAAVADIYFRVFDPAMVEVGELWCVEKVNVAQEHLATQITLAQMEKVRLAQALPRPLPYHAIVACVEGEQHFVGARMAADFLQLEGWVVDFLGPDVPSRALVEMVMARRPNLVALSVTLKNNLRRCRILIKQLKKLPGAPAFILGGRQLPDDAVSRGDFAAIEAVSTVLDGLRRAKKIVSGGRPAATLPVYLKELGRRIRDLRQRAGLTQEQLAGAARLTRAYVVSVEGGKQNVSMDVVLRLANALGVLPDRLLAMEYESSFGPQRLSP